jgi:hypothetical protein
MSWWLVHCDYWDEIVVYQDNDRKRRDNHDGPQREITNNRRRTVRMLHRGRRQLRVAPCWVQGG